MEDDSSPTVRDAQRAAFGTRLKTTRKKLKGPDGKPLYPSAVDFIGALEARHPDIQGRMYYNYEAGRNIPAQPDTINRIAEMLGVTSDWLLFGKGKQVNDGDFNQDAATINQAIEIPRGKPYKSPPVRYIPILSASQINSLLSGNGNLTTMSGEKLPVPQHIDAGADAFYYQISDSDTSMVGTAGFSFPPGTLLLIDPGRIIRPADFLLVQLPDADAPVIRRLQGRLSIDHGEPNSRIYPFRLLALNPMADPIEVTSSTDCKIVGRVVSFTQIL
jgi:SOS-response transcriptional repressor LexA